MYTNYGITCSRCGIDAPLVAQWGEENLDESEEQSDDNSIDYDEDDDE